MADKLQIIDINIHHLPEDLFTNEKVLNGFLNTAPRGFGEIDKGHGKNPGKGQTEGGAQVQARQHPPIWIVRCMFMAGWLSLQDQDRQAFIQFIMVITISFPQNLTLCF